MHLVVGCLCPTGQTTGFNAEARDRDLPFSSKDEPATLPRVSELIIITEYTPWCTIVKNPAGVTMNDICTTIWKEYVSCVHLRLILITQQRYTDNMVSDKEFESLPPRVQDQVRRHAAASASNGMYQYYSPAQLPTRFRRVGTSKFFVFPHCMIGTLI